MKRITIDSDAYKSLAEKIERIYNYIERQTEKQAVPSDPSTVWIDNAKAAELLEVSTGEVTYSIRGGRVRYRLSEIERLIAGRVFPRREKSDNL